MPDLEFEVLVLEQLTILNRKIDLLSRAIARVDTKENTIMATQADADALAQRLLALVSVENTSLDLIKIAVANLVQNNPTIDFTGLSDAVSQAETAASQEQDFAGGLQQPGPTA